MSGLINFNFEDFNVRFINNPDSDYDFGIFGKDLADILEYSDSAKLYNLVDDEYKYSYRQNGVDMIVLEEPGIYQALSRSNKPKAKPFQKWLYEKFLPNYRKKEKTQIDKILETLFEMKEEHKKERDDLKQEINDIKNNSQKLLESKSENEELGEKVKIHFPNVVEFNEYIEGNPLKIEEKFKYDEIYSMKQYYSLLEICEIFRPDYTKRIKGECVMKKVRHSIGLFYQGNSGKILPKSNLVYVFDKLNCLFLLWRLDTVAKELGQFKIDLTTDDLENILELSEVI